MYDRSDGGRLMRTYVSCNLGWWHTYKLVALKLWKVFAPSLLAPLWHHLYPNSQFHIKPSSLASVLYHYLALHWSYPSIKDELTGLLSIPADQTSLRFMNTVKDLIFFFEYAIPTVRQRRMCFHLHSFLFFISQLLDYGITMKLCDGKYGVEMLNRILCLLMMLTRGKSHMYIHSVMMQLLVLLHQRRNNTCAWQMLMGSLATFNEESGELSFSMLARCILGDTQKRKFAHLNKLYQQIHFYGEIERELGADGAGFNKNGNWRKKLDPEGAVVVAVTAHMRSVIRQIRGRVFRVYSGKPRTWRDLGPAMGTMKLVTNATPLWMPDMGPQLDKQLQKCKEKFSTFWVEPYKDMWPEFEHRPDMVQLLPSGMRDRAGKARARRAEAEDLVVDGDWVGEPMQAMHDKDNEHKSKAKPKKKRKRMGAIPRSDNESDSEYGCSSDSDDPQDAVPAPALPPDEDDLRPEPSDLFGAAYGDVDQANIRVDQPRQRAGRGGPALAPDSPDHDV
jgi:hypothetical protein